MSTEVTALTSVRVYVRKNVRPHHDKRFKNRFVTTYVVVAAIPALEIEALLTSPMDSKERAEALLADILADRTAFLSPITF